MRIFGAAAVLSACVLFGCIAWYRDLTSGNGPDHSVDLKPLVPILAAVAALAAIWAVAAIAWLFSAATRQKKADRDAP